MNAIHARSSNAPFRLAVIGSGPAGFYTAYRVMTKLPNTFVDMYESLPVPFGLVRHGVAPDHPEVKNCQEKFEEVASSPRFRFLGNVSVGANTATNNQCSVRLQSLMQYYDSILLSYGASEDKRLGIPGESTLRGIYSARQFVGWYNGLPECSSLDPLITSAEDAVIIGQGNVALDVARILLEDIDILRKTDITEDALQKLSQSRIKRVHIVGRRGPLQAAFTIKEARELMKLSSVAFHPIDRSLIPKDLKILTRASRRLMEVILKGSAATSEHAFKSWYLHNCLSPSRFLRDETSPAQVGSTEFNVMKLKDAFDPLSKSFATSETICLPSNVVFRSVGYKSVALPEFSEMGVQFDEIHGVVKNDGLGRVMQAFADGEACLSPQFPGVYCAGWVKSGPTGVIASTMQDAFITGEAIIQDWIAGAKFLRSNDGATAQGWDGVKQEDGLRADLAVSWEQWRQIDRAEKQSGKERGKTREKFTNTRDMLTAIR
ncbi:NADPH-adrenodoxin reductase [Conoideocrella luteorostrata]|uniref:NADPH:adrenodoxin oxidoreductase, mitochondrial n=1 Tax=Conoideocrella luteorostrata TaxID=1105319 RepID=A0AAJ0D113_9HYPO|nr:NADPH-adrenodoxin reductase [Conoideocrella luteorostrata]